MIPDLYFLDRVPGVDDRVGLPGSGADVIIDPTEQTAHGVTAAGGFSRNVYGTSAPNTFDIDGTSYVTSSIERVTFSHAGGTGTGHVLTIYPEGGSQPQFLFVPDDAAGDLDLSSFVITDSETVDYLDAPGIATDQTHSFAACLATGTAIATPGGPRRIEDIRPGDPVLTLDHGALPCLLALRRQVRASGFLPPRLAPVFVPAGALGPAEPVRGLHLSRQHRILLRGPVVRAVTGTPEVLAAAKDLCGWNGITVDLCRDRVQFVHLLLPGHQIIRAEGMATESLFVAEPALAEVRGQLGDPSLAAHRPARPILTAQMARILLRALKRDAARTAVRAGQPAFHPA